jgi:hypothetical protein
MALWPIVNVERRALTRTTLLRPIGVRVGKPPAVLLECPDTVGDERASLVLALAALGEAFFRWRGRRAMVVHSSSPFCDSQPGKPASPASYNFQADTRPIPLSQRDPASAI